jgi:hypothetical protein
LSQAGWQACNVNLAIVLSEIFCSIKDVSWLFSYLAPIIFLDENMDIHIMSLGIVAMEWFNNKPLDTQTPDLTQWVAKRKKLQKASGFKASNVVKQRHESKTSGLCQCRQCTKKGLKIPNLLPKR